ncbi:Pkinase-domain-containing protein [Coniochaeta sp. PMI_546]|nr:Pkinase-domain-containing protein [Coniochaeta sp. PMI_546]
MASRGNFRGGYHAYSHNSGHGTPNSSYHGSPTGPSHSPYGSNGRGWSNQQPYSPQQPYPPQYSQGGYGAQNGSQGPYQSNSPPYPPTGPAAQYPQGPSYRGRGGPSGFRGNQFGPGRGGYRAGFKNPQWNSGPGSGRGQHAPSVGDETDPAHATPDHTEKSQPGEDAKVTDNDNPFRPSKDLQVEDTSKLESAADEQMPPPNRIPPTGPQSSSKFSFAFKASKPTVAAPKPEISSKFNAAPPRQPQSQQSSERDRRDLPRNVPTEPASARSRGVDHRQQQHQQQRAEPPPPRVRMVKKIMKRLKKKTPLDPELASSDSVYFRKPGDKSVIGSGTYGKVFKGLNVYTKNLVALKKIKMEGERDGFPVTAVREIKLLQSLKHPNIVNLQEVMVEKNDCFMVFEYLSHDLTGLLNHPSYKLNPAQKKDLAKQMFEALDYLHKRGVLHRDIKAANILVSSEGILKLADFGLARFYAKRHQLDYTNRVITIWYRSPELLLGETQYGPAVDIWSAACVLVEIFTRHAIFPGNGSEIDQLDKIYAILGTPNKQEWPNLVEMPWFELLRPGYRKPNVFAEKYKDRLSPAGFELLCSLFQYDPAKRPTAAEVLEHAYFKTEEPAPKQAVELQNLDGDWHELDSKALRRENERKEKEAKRAAAKEAGTAISNAGAPPEKLREISKDRKRPGETHAEPQREAKRPHVDQPEAEKAAAAVAAPAKG